MKQTLRSIGLLIILSSSGLGAEDFRFTGFWDYFGGIEPSVGYENLESRVYMNPFFSGYSDRTGLEWVLSSEIIVRPLGDPICNDPWEIIDEAYLFLPAGDFDFLLGQKVVTYGFADLYGPLNVLHSTNRAALSLDESYDARRSDPLLQITYYPTYSDTLEMTFVAFTRPDKERNDSVYLADTQDSVIWSDEDWLIEEGPSLVLSYTRYSEKMDWQFLYGNYIEQTPDFEISSVDSTPSSLTAVYNRKQTFGVAYSTGLGETTFSQEIAFNLTSDWEGTDPGAQDSDITVNTQILANLPWGILSQTSIVYSYFFNHGKYDDYGDTLSADYLAEAIYGFHTQPFQHIAFIVEHMEKSFLRDKLKTQLNVALLYPNLFIEPRAAFSINDYWAFETGADITLADPSDKEFLRNPSNDNYYVRLVYRY